MVVAVDAKKFGAVGVLMGGDSSERAISLDTGAAVLDALCRQGVQAYGIDWDGQGLPKIDTERCDRIFIALHGRGGEDGQVQGVLQIMGIPFTGSGVLGSALAMDKIRSKKIWLSMGLPTPSFRELTDGFSADEILESLGSPLMVKPSQEGSSVGASKVMRAEQLTQAWRQAVKYDSKVLAEQWIEGEEYTVAILDGQALPVVRLETPREFYDYEAKYLADTTSYHCPSGLSVEQESSLQTLALQAGGAVDLEGWGRVDLMIDGDGKRQLLEVNTVPGMTSHSLVPMAAKAAGIGFDELVVKILATTQ